MAFIFVPFLWYIDTDMKLIDLQRKQVEDIESRLEDYDEKYTRQDLEGIIQIGIVDDNGKLIGGLDACITTFKILYVSTLFVDEEYRRKGYGRQMIEEMERRAKAMGVNTIRLDTFDWQGKEFYQALNYEVVGHYENKEDGYSEYFFLKRL